MGVLALVDCDICTINQSVNLVWPEPTLTEKHAEIQGEALPRSSGSLGHIHPCTFQGLFTKSGPPSLFLCETSSDSFHVTCNRVNPD